MIYFHQGHDERYTVNNYRQKLCFFSTRICYKLCSKSLLKELHRIKLLHIEIIDNAGRKKTKLLPIEFICTSHNSVSKRKFFRGKKQTNLHSGWR